MTVKLGTRIEADVSPLVEALATAGQALDQFEGRVQAANDELIPTAPDIDLFCPLATSN